MAWVVVGEKGDFSSGWQMGDRVSLIDESEDLNSFLDLLQKHLVSNSRPTECVTDDIILSVKFKII